jgi:hypothetical protein
VGVLCPTSTWAKVTREAIVGGATIPLKGLVVRESLLNLLQEWSNWQASRPPFVLKLDKAALGSKRNARRIVTIESWPKASRARDFGAPKDSRLHLGLLPQPFLGDLRRASIYILGLNPGLGPGDYYAEYKVPKFRKALLANLKQKFKRDSLPFLFLDPQYAWHGGFAWWHRKLADVIARLAQTRKEEFAKARAYLARELASIELVAYHSSKSAGGWVRRLPFVSLARAFVHDFVIPRVRRGEAVAIAIRQEKIWGLPKEIGFVSYTSQEALAASLSAHSRGGRAILQHLRSA